MRGRSRRSAASHGSASQSGWKASALRNSSAEDLRLEPALVDPVAGLIAGRRAEDEAAEEVAVQGVEVEAGPARPGRTRRRAPGRAPSCVVGRVDQVGEEARPERRGGVDLRAAASGRTRTPRCSRRTAGPGTTPASAPGRRSACGGPSAASSCPCSVSRSWPQASRPTSLRGSRAWSRSAASLRTASWSLLARRTSSSTGRSRAWVRAYSAA